MDKDTLLKEIEIKVEETSSVKNLYPASPHERKALDNQITILKVLHFLLRDSCRS